MQPIRLVFAAALAAVTSAPALAQFTLVAPNGYAAVEGASNNSFPWSRGTASMRFQQMYDSTHFTAQGVTSPIIISRVRFRANATAGTWAGGTWPNVQISMSTAAVDFLAASTTFATNHGPDLAIVRSGPVTVTPGPGNGTTVPGPWYVDLPLTTNFTYDPTLGSDLVFDVALDGLGWTGVSTACDAISGATAVLGPPVGTRIYSSTSHTATTGTIGLHHMLATEFSYLPANGLFPGFSANVTTGNSPLAVQFTDSSYSSDPSGVTSWAWDVNGDSVVDYTVQNPLHTYNSCGVYTVSLTVTDTTHLPATETKTGYISVDPIVAAFTGTPTAGFAPHMVQFTDASTGPVLAYAWDLDGDTLIDSTAQNPSWIYALPGNYNVSLTVTNACFSDTETKTGYIIVVAPGSAPPPPELLEYQFNEVRGTSVANTATTLAMASHGTVSNANWQGNQTKPLFRGNEAGFGMLANSNNVASANIVDSNGPLNVAGNMSVSWWQRMNTASGATIGYTFGGTGPAVRCFTGGVAGNSLWYRGSPSGDINATYNVQANPGVWEHVCLVVNDALGIGQWYFNGVLDTTTLFPPNTHTFALTEFHWGYQTATSSGYTRYYDTDDVRIYSRALSAFEVQLINLLGENASAGTWGTSCDGPGGTPVIAGNSRPSVGNGSFAINLTNAEDNRLCAIVFGLTPAAFGTFDLSGILGPGCLLHVDWFVATFHVTASNSASQPLPIPNDMSLQGLHVYGQWLIAGTSGAVTRPLDINIE